MAPKRIEPSPGQESVWDYPRPPHIEDTSHHIRVVVSGQIIAYTYQAKRVLETSHPPVYYIPPKDVQMAYLTLNHHATWCEWKGQATYFTVTVGNHHIQDAGWTYLNPTPNFAAIKGYIAFYPSKMETCTVNGEIVEAQPGDFYGGWITKDIVGPYKGASGIWGW